MGGEIEMAYFRRETNKRKYDNLITYVFLAYILTLPPLGRGPYW